MRNRASLTLGIALVFVGGYFVIDRYLTFRGSGSTVILIGLIFLAISATRGFSGPLLPGSILTGLGLGMVSRGRLSWLMPGWGTIVLGLGIGLLFVASIDARKNRHRRPSPLSLGAILCAVGVGSILAHRLPRVAYFVHAGEYWPWAVVAAGALLILRSSLARR